MSGVFSLGAVDGGLGGWERGRLSALMGMTAPLLGRAERSTPEARRGHAVWRAGVDGESADQAIMVLPTMRRPCEGAVRGVGRKRKSKGGPKRGPPLRLKNAYRLD